MIASSTALPLTVITHEFFPRKGGIATFVEEMSQACHELGHSVEVWAPQSFLPEDRTFPFPVRRVRLRGTHDLSCQLRMAREIIRHRRRLRAGIVYLPEPGPVLAMTYLQFFKAFKPARLLLTFHGSEVQRFAASPGSRILIGQLIGAADRVTTLSRFTQGLLHDRFPNARSKSVVTPGALRAGFLGHDTSHVKASDKVVVLSVGRLHPRKGQMHIMEALDGLPGALAGNIELWLVGRGSRGSYEGELRQRAARCQVPVHFFGNIDNDDLLHLYRRADIFALTSVNHGNSVEGFGLAYLEASAFGLPIVGHDVGGVSEAVREGETALLVAPGDTRALTAAIERLLKDPHLRERMGTAGRIWARRNSWKDSARLLLEGIPAAPSHATTPSKRPALQPA